MRSARKILLRRSKITATSQSLDALTAAV